MVVLLNFWSGKLPFRKTEGSDHWAVVLILGPKILLLLPIWYLGVFCIVRNSARILSSLRNRHGVALGSPYYVAARDGTARSDYGFARKPAWE